MVLLVLNLLILIKYRFIKHNLRHLSYISIHLDSGNVCHACPQVCSIVLACSLVIATFYRMEER